MSASDVANRLSEDAQQINSIFLTSVYDPGYGVIAVCNGWGFQPGDTADIELEVDVDDDVQTGYSEGQALPAPIESNIQVAKFAFYQMRAVARITGTERRRIGSMQQGAVVQDGSYADRKIARAMFALTKGISQYFDNSATYGLPGIIDDGTTYQFGSSSAITRTTYTATKSYLLSASNAAISTSLMNKTIQLGMDSPYGGEFNLALASSTQCYKIAELQSGKVSFNDNANQAMTPTGLFFGHVPLYMMPSLSTSSVYVLSGARVPDAARSAEMDGSMNGNWGVVWNEENAGRYHVLDLGAANNDNVLNIQLSTSLLIACNAPQKQAELHTLSTS